jgi:DNA-binding Xre family transcriptional regulator
MSQDITSDVPLSTVAKVAAALKCKPKDILK